MNLDRGVLRSLPKVLLHEHLDGVLRPKTVIGLARSAKYDQLPTEDPDEPARWFYQGANQGSLPKYLEGFAHKLWLQISLLDNSQQGGMGPSVVAEKD